MFDALVVEHDRHAPQTDEDRHAHTVNQRAGVIDLELLAAIEHNREGAERNPLLKRTQSLLEVARGHRSLRSWEGVDIVPRTQTGH